MDNLGPLALIFALAVIPALANAQPASGLFQDWNETTTPRTPTTACSHLRTLTNYEISVDAATLVLAEGDTPEFCLVQGQIISEVRFEVGLPDRLVASQRQDGKTVRTRPLCPYPMVARHTGSGSVDDAANFRCVAPRPSSSSR